jgi:hypothetical protein
LELDRARAASAVSVLNDIAQELKGMKFKGADLFAKRAAGYAKVYGSNTRATDLNAVLDLPANFPVSLGLLGSNPSQASLVMPRVLVWMDQLVRFADDIPMGEYALPDLRKVTDIMVATAALPLNQDAYLEAKVLQRSALIRLRVAEQDSKGDDRKLASEWFNKSVSLLNPKTPILWKWHDMFARELLTIGRIKARSKIDRKADLEEAMSCAQTALQLAPGSQTNDLNNLISSTQGAKARLQEEQ